MRTGRKGEGGRGFGSSKEIIYVPGWNPEIFPGSGFQPGNFSVFRVGTRKFFRVPGWNPEIFPCSGLEPGNFSGFRVGTRNPEISGFFRIVFQPGKIVIFPGFSGLEPGTRNSGGNPNCVPRDWE